MALTPMMQHYLQTKEQVSDAILFYRLGDFYEMFFEDAKTVSRELELTLTGKDCGLEERAPMCGVPYHAVDTYLRRLIEKGYKVAICEQLTEPNNKGLVERGIIRIVTPGTVIEPSLLEEKRSNYILSIALNKKSTGFAYCDVSTGEFMAFALRDGVSALTDVLAWIKPAEIIASGPLDGVRISATDPESFTHKAAAKCVKAHFGDEIDELCAESGLAIGASGALLAYLLQTQKNALRHITRLRWCDRANMMVLDQTALANLELTQTVRDKGRRGSLLWALDRTATAMGSRLLRSWIEQPLCDAAKIARRQDAVEALLRDPMNADALREELSGVYDVERLLSRIAYETVHARDTLSLLASLEAVTQIRRIGAQMQSPALDDLFARLDDLRDLQDELRHAISPDAPLSVKEGGVIADGYNEELDELRAISVNAKQYLAQMENEEREKTGIKNLRIGYNRVFGYYIEVTKAFYSLVPYTYTRKQTLANCERFITEELKTLENKIIGATERAEHLEYALFCGIREKLKTLLPTLKNTVESLKALDVLQSFAALAQERDYTRPKLNEEGRYEIREGRHPVVEESIGRERFVPNDTSLDAEHRVMIITGPNMAGKSTYMRQVALIVLMAHIGSYVPAESADIALTDRIFTRIGASDDLYAGQSTFMVEMREMATILKYATPRSLLILDEVGRGTSTFDGLSIAWASVEHIAGAKCGARTLFATHYHELSELEGRLDGVVNYRVTAREQGEEVLFLRKVVPGGEDRSYGVAVAKLAGLPKGVVSRARQIMAKLEVDAQLNGSIGASILEKSQPQQRQLGILDVAPMELCEEIAHLDVTGMTPMDALNKLYELSEKAKRI